MFKWLNPKNWGIFKVYRDIENFLDWRKTIKKEETNPRSKYNLFKLQRTKLYDIYIIVSLEDEDAFLSENVKRVKVLESLNPVHRYLDEELGFAGNLQCEFNQFVDDKGVPTLSYLIVYRFIFEKFSILWLLKFIIINGILIYIILKYNIIPLIINWISNFNL